MDTGSPGINENVGRVLPANQYVEMAGGRGWPRATRPTRFFLMVDPSLRDLIHPTRLHNSSPVGLGKERTPTSLVLTPIAVKFSSVCRSIHRVHRISGNRAETPHEYWLPKHAVPRAKQDEPPGIPHLQYNLLQIHVSPTGIFSRYVITD
jgi:hypothetical protein